MKYSLILILITILPILVFTGCSRLKPIPTDAEILASVGIESPKPGDKWQVQRKVRVLPVAGSDFQRRETP